MDWNEDEEMNGVRLVPIVVPFLKNKKCEIGNFDKVNNNMTKSTFIKCLQPSNLDEVNQLGKPHYGKVSHFM